MIGSIILLFVLYAILVGIYYGYKVFSVNKSACFGLEAKCWGLDGGGEEKIRCEQSNMIWMTPWFASGCGSSAKALQAQYECYEDLISSNPDILGEEAPHGKLLSHIINPENAGITFGDPEYTVLLTEAREHCNSVVKKGIKFKTSWLYFGDGF
jgi:hypothetical protein